jgi:hypothetical protein
MAPAVEAQTANTEGTPTAPDTCAAVMAAAIAKLQEKAKEIQAKPDLTAALAEFTAFADKVKDDVQRVCTVDKEIAVLQQAKEIIVDTTVAAAKLKLDVCRHKIAALGDFLRRYFGWVPPENVKNELRIVRAEFGDVVNQRRFPRIRQICDATPFLKQNCSAGGTYCSVSASSGLDTSVCGFDPSPQGAKEICVTYKCGEKPKFACWPSNTTRIDLVCSYPPRIEARPRSAAETAAIEQERLFLAADPCPVAVPEKPRG